MSGVGYAKRRVAPAAALLLALGAAACSGGDGGDDAPPPTPPPGGQAPTRIEDSFGTGFAGLFRADPNSDPRDPVAADVPALSLTTDPIPVP